MCTLYSCEAVSTLYSCGAVCKLYSCEAVSTPYIVHWTLVYFEMFKCPNLICCELSKHLKVGLLLLNQLYNCKHCHCINTILAEGFHSTRYEIAGLIPDFLVYLLVYRFPGVYIYQ